MVEAKKRTLINKLIEVSKAIGYLQKDKKNKMQGYNYLSEAKIKETIKKHFEEQGIVFNYSTVEVREYEISPTHKGTKQFVTIAEGTYQFIDSESDVAMNGTWFGSGSDTGDKGLYKAITGGIKYVLNTNFLIPTGDDPEKDNENGNNGNSKTTTRTNQGNINGELKTPDSWNKDSSKLTQTQIKKLFLEYHNGDKTNAKEDYDLWKDMPEPTKSETLENIKEKVKGKAA